MYGRRIVKETVAVLWLLTETGTLSLLELCRGGVFITDLHNDFLLWQNRNKTKKIFCFGMIF